MNIQILFPTHEKTLIKFNAKAVPRVGDKIDLFCKPFPTVVDVVWWPEEEKEMSNEQLFFRIYKAVLDSGASRKDAAHYGKKAAELLKKGRSAQQAIDHCVRMATRQQLRP